MKKIILGLFVIILILIVCIPVAFKIRRSINTHRLISQRSQMESELSEVLEAKIEEQLGIDLDFNINCETYSNKKYHDNICITIQNPDGFESKSDSDKMRFIHEINSCALELFHAEVEERYPFYNSVMDEGVNYSVGKEGYISIDVYYYINIKTKQHKYEYVSWEQTGLDYYYNVDGGNTRVNGQTVQFTKGYKRYTPKYKSSNKSSTNKSSSSKSNNTYYYGSSSKKQDPYDVYDYDDPDDFADEWEDEFDDWDDAWEYWDEAH